MAERRNANAHSLNVVTFDGVSEAGKGNDIKTRLTSARDGGVGSGHGTVTRRGSFRGLWPTWRCRWPLPRALRRGRNERAKA